MGHPKETLGYYFYTPLDNKVFVARDIEFLEEEYLLQESKEAVITNQVEHVAPALRRSGRVSQQPERYVYLIDSKKQEVADHNEPSNYQEDMGDLELKKWLKAMNAEQSMKDNEVWDLVDLPPGSKSAKLLLKVGL
ncbi:hypothetical protein Tco_0289928 [Tanacetum coccineum]